MSRIVLIYNPGEPNNAAAFVALQDYAKGFGVRIDPLIARNLGETRAALSALSKDGPDAVYLLNTAANYTNRELICSETARTRLPTMTDWSQFPDSGCLASYANSGEEFPFVHTDATLLADVETGHVATVYADLDDWFGWGCLTALVVLAATGT